TRPTIELLVEMLHAVLRQTYREAEPDQLLLGGRAMFEPRSRLALSRLLRIGEEAGGDEPLPLRSVRVDDRITSYLLGSDAPDSRLREVMIVAVKPIAWDQLVADNQHVEQLQGLAGWWRAHQGRSRRGAVLLLHGAYGSGRLSSARALCGDLRTALLVADVEAALRAACGWEEAVHLCYREALLDG